MSIVIEMCPGCDKQIMVDVHLDLRMQGYDLNSDNKTMHWYCYVDNLREQIKVFTSSGAAK